MNIPQNNEQLLALEASLFENRLRTFLEQDDEDVNQHTNLIEEIIEQLQELQGSIEKDVNISVP